MPGGWPPQLSGHLTLGIVKLCLAYGKIVKLYAVELKLQGFDSLVALSLDLVNHLAHSGKETAHVKRRPLE